MARFERQAEELRLQQKRLLRRQRKFAYGALMNFSATIIQAYVRGWLVRKVFSKLKVGKFLSCWLWFRFIVRKRHLGASVLLQYLRHHKVKRTRYSMSRRFVRKYNAIRTLQAFVRIFLAKCLVRRLKPIRRYSIALVSHYIMFGKVRADRAMNPIWKKRSLFFALCRNYIRSKRLERWVS